MGESMREKKGESMGERRERKGRGKEERKEREGRGNGRPEGREKGEGMGEGNVGQRGERNMSQHICTNSVPKIDTKPNITVFEILTKCSY